MGETTLTRRLQFEIYVRYSDGLFDWRTVAANGQIIGTSGGQGYSSRFNAHRALDRFLDLAGADPTKVEIVDVR